jgi:hypothetical protein
MYIGNFTQCPNMRPMTVYASQCFDIDRMLIITFFSLYTSDTNFTSINLNYFTLNAKKLMLQKLLNVPEVCFAHTTIA